MTPPTVPTAEQPIVHELTKAATAFDWAKILAFMFGVFLVGVWMMAEVSEFIGLPVPMLLGVECDKLAAQVREHHFPWGVFFAAILMIAPAMVGRGVAGDVFKSFGEVLRAAAQRIRGVKGDA